MTRESLLKLLLRCKTNRERIIAAFAAVDYEPQGFQIENFTADLDVSSLNRCTVEELNKETLAVYEQLLRWKFVAGQRGEGR